ncbi:MAG: FHA domain-containing protein [Desulfobacteraceae bacterium]|nr:MAG: FHA domain-containing protein [Desulfobacteraceae bacterium]
MTDKPTIVVQLVHIEGPLKGEIQDYLNSEISIGRHPSCQVQFPKHLAIISRQHALITREGNRFKLSDQSANGTFVNGKRVKEAYLKSGDVLIFAEGGPKVSFLTRIEESAQALEKFTQPGIPIETESKPVQKIAPTPPPTKPTPERQVSIQKVQVPLIIQYGPTLRSFKELPVIIGKNPDCDFSLEHPEILDRHIQLFFDQGQYWVKDLTGRNMVVINAVPVRIQAPLNPDNLLSLSPKGPTFRFLGGGRLAEHEEPAPELNGTETQDKNTI